MFFALPHNHDHVQADVRDLSLLRVCKPSRRATRHLRNAGRNPVDASDSFASSVRESPAHFSSARATLISSSSANPAPSKIGANGPGGDASLLFPCSSNPSLHHSHLLLMSDKVPFTSVEINKTEKCVWRGRIPKGLNSSSPRPISVSSRNSIRKSPSGWTVKNSQRLSG